MNVCVLLVTPISPLYGPVFVVCCTLSCTLQGSVLEVRHHGRRQQPGDKDLGVRVVDVPTDTALPAQLQLVTRLRRLASAVPLHQGAPRPQRQPPHPD